MEKKHWIWIIVIILLLGSCSSRSKNNEKATDSSAKNETIDKNQTKSIPKETKGLKTGDYQYNLLEDNTVEIIKYTGNKEHLVIPESLDKYTVKSILSTTFNSNKLISVTIPNSITTVESNLFLNCKNLESIIVSVDHPNLACIDGVLFNKNDKCLISCPRAIKEETYYIPQGIKTIGKEAFCNCTSLKNIIIPDTVRIIEDMAFSSCNGLSTITIPNSVIVIGGNPFILCNHLSDIIVSPDHPYFGVVGGVLYSKTDKRLICYPCVFQNSIYNIPQGVKEIGHSAFYGCKYITHLTIPDDVNVIGKNAFYGCTSLVNATIPNSVIEIRDFAFYGCSSLSNVTIPNSVKTIGDGAFLDCNKLISITIPNSVIRLGNSAFSFCSSLKSATLPDGLYKIDYSMFNRCSSLTEVTIPNGVKEIGDSAFNSCSNLTSIIIPDSIEKIGDGAFYDCNEHLVVTVGRNSYAKQYCIENKIEYTYPDLLDWLSN